MTMGFCFLIISRLPSLSIPLLLIYSSSVTALLPSVDRSRSTLSSSRRQLRPWHRDDSGFVDDTITGAAAMTTTTEDRRPPSRHSSIINPLSQENKSPTTTAPSPSSTNRRNILAGLLPKTTTAFALTLSLPQSATTTAVANAIDNPLNLKGTFWETGQLYQKNDATLPGDDDNAEFLSILENAAEALRSPALIDAISEGNYERASRLLRGGLISESRIRLAANYLIDSIPEENEESMYRASEGFRIFLRYLDVLDAEVEAASRPLSLGKGSGGGMDDPRMKILTRLGEVEDALKSFLKSVRGGLGK
eukprot:CAMPEP_0181115940 /NCGR_PEP_ID=MMETSP1071-20121207/21690_1 /TAXON_ID=35127 /ORGANISM="Thalassiosira sp., Strain NH16" /LENGTH=306 /DNA_ID=CAMNT_0023200161 /DNA_START=149 /DNA_END=1069 /DNA_ORIENTATION=+